MINPLWKFLRPRFLKPFTLDEINEETGGDPLEIRIFIKRLIKNGYMEQKDNNYILNIKVK